MAQFGLHTTRYPEGEKKTTGSGDTEAMKEARQTPGDHAGPHDAFPIASAKNVKSAFKLSGKAADPEQVRSNIKRIAKRKGLASAIPKADK